MRKLFGKLTLIDLTIILLLILAVAFAFYKTTQTDSNVQKFSFDSSEMQKVNDKYQDLYSQGKLVYSRITGYNAINGKPGQIYGQVLWTGYDNREILLNVTGKLLLASLYQNKYADFYINSITLEVVGSEKNATDIVFEPKSLPRISDLLINIPSVNKYYIITTIAFPEKSSEIFQKLDDELYKQVKHVSLVNNPQNNKLELFKTTPQDLKIADQFLGNLNGQTDYITIRFYNLDKKQLEEIKKKYKVVKIVNINSINK
jgi:hypothetical protein